jgi:hypothetical protein
MGRPCSPQPHSQVGFCAIFFMDAKKHWDKGEVTEVHSIKNPTKAQFFLEQIGLLLGLLYIINGPLLFLPASRGSLLNTFLGVRYGVAIKWHRCSAVAFQWAILLPLPPSLFLLLAPAK